MYEMDFENVPFEPLVHVLSSFDDVKEKLSSDQILSLRERNVHCMLKDW